MVTLRGGESRVVSSVAERPGSLRAALGGIPPAQRDHYLSMREAFLSLERTSELFRPARSFWQPVLRVGRSEIATVDFVPRLRKGMAVRIKPLPEDWLAGLMAASELRPVTRRRLRNGGPGQSIPLPVNTDADLADVVVVLLLLHARLMGGGRL